MKPHFRQDPHDSDMWEITDVHGGVTSVAKNDKRGIQILCGIEVPSFADEVKAYRLKKRGYTRKKPQKMRGNRFVKLKKGTNETTD